MLRQRLFAALAVSISGILLAIVSPILLRKDEPMADQSISDSDPLQNIGLTEEEILTYRYLCSLANMSTGKNFPSEITRESIREYIALNSARYCPRCFRWYSNEVMRCVYCTVDPLSTTGVITMKATVQEFRARVLAWEDERQKLIEKSGIAYTRADIIRLLQLAVTQKARW